jgi:hypothetical protein
VSTEETESTGPPERVRSVPAVLRQPQMLRLLHRLYEGGPDDKVAVLCAAADITGAIVERGGVIRSLDAKMHLLGSALAAGIDEDRARAEINRRVPGPHEYAAGAPISEGHATELAGPWWLGVLWPAPSGGWDYLGGNLSHSEPVSGVTLSFDDNGFHAKSPAGLSMHLAWSSVHGIDVEGSDAVQGRITATRLVLVGWLALAWRKKENASFLSVETAAGTAVFARAETLHEMRVRLSALLSAAPTLQPLPPVASPAEPAFMQPDVLDQIRRLGELARDEFITAEEFAAAKEELLRRL